MNSEVIDEDAVDTEALQAQIDLSMSFAQNLISSWMEPYKFPTSSRTRNLEQELAEHMKRPPRLGVGAVVPEGMQSHSRETARLKGKLSGSKHAREDEDVGPSKTVSDDEGESRAGAIKKKARSDPFDIVHGKKKKKNKDTESSAVQMVIPTPHEGESKLDSSDEIEDILNGPDKLDESPIKSKKKPKKAVHITNGVDVHIPQQTGLSAPLTNPASSETPSTPPRNSQIETLREAIDVSLTKTPALRKHLPSELLKVPLLNLTKPPSDPESDSEPVTPSTSPKKKRKRRKKRKSILIPESTPTTNPSHQAISPH